MFARTAFLSYGFRPFFFGGALWAACAMPLWIALTMGYVKFAVSYGAVAWHAHEFLFGYVTAIIAGFLLTAVPNWTERPPVRGGTLLFLFALWVAGRIALLAIDWIGFLPAIMIDSLFLPALAAVVFREIIAAGDRRNVKVAIILLVLAIVNILFHFEVLLSGMAGYTLRTGLSAIIGLIILIGGRIIPSFTRNWLIKRTSSRLPASSSRYDIMAVSGGVLALVLWIAMPHASATAIALLAAGLLHSIRVSRWTGLSTWREPLVLILHVGYAFVPLGFMLVASAVLWPSIVPAGGALHAWTAGTIGVMTLAVMTRVSLGHSGRALTAKRSTQAIYIAIIFVAISRIAAPFLGNYSLAILTLAGAGWTLAFLGFVVVYGPILLRARIAPA